MKVLFTAIFVLLQAGVGNAQYAVFSPDSSISVTVTTDKAAPLEAQYKGTQILGHLPSDYQFAAKAWIGPDEDPEGSNR